MTPTVTLNRAAEWIGYQMAVRPALRRVGMIWLTTHMLTLWAVLTAPKALAYPVINAMAWTGITDSHGVPLGAYYLSTVSTAEAITEAGPDLSLDPNSWVSWLASAVTVGFSHDSIAMLLQLQASIYILMLTLALWLLKFVMSSVWLHWLATWFRPVFDTLQRMVADFYLFPICLVAALGVGAFHVVANNHRGHGWRVMLSTIVIAVLGWTVTRDPISELANDNGMLTQARNLGLTVSSAALNNGGIAPGGSSAQMSTLIQHIADATVRMPLQLFNFGTVVDNLGSCGNAWSTAIMSGDTGGPAHAMTSCGAPQALSYAQHLDGSSFGLGMFYLLFGSVFTFFVLYVAYSYVMVACAAFINAVMLLFAAPLAMIEGAPRRRALHRLTQFFRHVVLVFAYVLYISFAAVIVLKMAAPGGYAAQVGMTSPVALMFMVGFIAVAATGTFIWLKKQLGDHTRQSLTQKIRSSVDHTKSGWHKGQRAKDKIEAAAIKMSGAGQAAPPAGAATSGGAAGGGGPLTGTPSPGRRPAAGRTSGSRRAQGPAGVAAPGNRPAAAPQPQSSVQGGAGQRTGSAPAAGSARGTRAKAAATTAAKVAAPEAAAAAGAAGKAASIARRDPSTVQQGRNGTRPMPPGAAAGRQGGGSATPPIPPPHRGLAGANQPPTNHGAQWPTRPETASPDGGVGFNGRPDDDGFAGPAHGRSPYPPNDHEQTG